MLPYCCPLLQTSSFKAQFVNYLNYIFLLNLPFILCHWIATASGIVIVCERIRYQNNDNDCLHASPSHWIATASGIVIVCERIRYQNNDNDCLHAFVDDKSISISLQYYTNSNITNAKGTMSFLHLLYTFT